MSSIIATPHRLKSLLFAGLLTLMLILPQLGMVTHAAGDPSALGQWGPVLDWGVFGKHMVLLPTGKVLVWPTGEDARVWDPMTQTSVPVPALFGDLHCAGQT